MPMVFVAPALFVFLWVLLAAWLLGLAKNNRSLVARKIHVAHYFGYAQVKNQAQEIGWNLGAKEFFGIILFAIAIGFALATIFRNPLIIFAGIVAGYYLPRYLLQRMKKHQRMSLMMSVPDFGRLLNARLIDHHSIVRAFEITHQDLTGPIKTMVEEFVKDVGVGIGIPQALENLKAKVGFRKFNTFAETLLIAHQEGYSEEALRAMEKAMEAIELDLKAIEVIQFTTRKKKRELFYVVIAAWIFPVLLSFMNADNANIYLDSVAGKILMFSYIISTLLVLMKGEEYLSLKLEEL